MLKARKVLKRIKAVRSIRTVTRTMEMMASTRFKRAHDRAVAARPYTDRFTDLVGSLAAQTENGTLSHPLLKDQEHIRRDVLWVITSQTGMCGAYNASILSVATARYAQLLADGYAVLLRVVGRRGIQYLRFRSYAMDQAIPEFDPRLAYATAARLADEAMAEFIAGKISGLEVAYTQFLASGQPSAAIAQLLPLTYTVPSPQPGVARPSYEFLPSPQEILDKLLPAVVRLRLYQCFLDAAVSEQIARMRAMRAATENADQMLHDLTVHYNRWRQAQITTELAEIMGGMMGMD
ncbi:MAG: ATP synthase F1 subunit gamma [Phycisphaerae bacterium]|jgi:F-type H+-transporting ATPase subunit gamma